MVAVPTPSVKTTSDRNSIRRLVCRLSFAICIALASGCSKTPDWQTRDISGVMPDLTFKLINEQGQATTAAAFRGDITFLYFGYTYCPDVCPATLARLSAVIDQLPESAARNIRVLFVSVDPERDTPKRLGQYTRAFGPEFVGLTGTSEQLKTATKRYRVTYSYGEKDEYGNYIVNHSSSIFVFDPEGRVRLLMQAYGNGADSVEDMTQDIARLARATDVTASAR